MEGPTSPCGLKNRQSNKLSEFMMIMMMMMMIVMSVD